MTIQTKPDYGVGIWASNGDIAQPTSEKIEIGHIVEKPLKEVMNYIQNRQDSAIVYTFQQGIAEWDSQTEYPIDAYTKRNGKIYNALSQNTNNDPTSFPLIWKLSFDEYGSAETVQEDVDRIKTEDGYLDLYVSKSLPVMTYKCDGVSYSALKGTPLSTSDQFGFQFKDHETKGLFLNSSDVPIISNGTDTYLFKNTGSENDVIRRKELQESLRTYKVGDIYLTIGSDDPSIRLGYGTWQRFAQGKALVGVSEPSSSNPAWTKFVTSEFGEYEHTLSKEEIPNLSGKFMTIQPQGYVNTGEFIKIQSEDATISGDRTPWQHDTLTVNFGSGFAHQNVQPSITVNIWLRVS